MNRIPRRRVDGVLLLDKPSGCTSNAALQRVKRYFRAEKAGHTGNLDPIATGLLPICLGESTKFAQGLLDAGKTYVATARLGITTDTLDREGAILQQRPVTCDEAVVRQALAGFLGPQQQVPPMYSALKQEGKPLYEYARAGEERERVARPVTIEQIELLAWRGDEIDFSVACSKGTYIRVLAADLGELLGCGAHLTALRRTRLADFDIADAVSLDRLDALDEAGRDACLLPVDCMLQNWTAVQLDSESAFYFQRGNPVWRSRAGPAPYRVYDDKQRFLGIAELDDDGRIAPKRLLSIVEP